MWDFNLDTWNNLIVTFGILSGIFVLLTGGSTYFAYQLQKAETEAANERLSANEVATERAKEGAALAHARAVEAELALEKFRAGRILTEDQKNELKALLMQTPKGAVIIKPNFLSPEPTRYAKALADIFNQAGFSDVGDKPLSVVSTNRPGLFVVMKDQTQIPKHLMAIVAAFKEVKIPFTLHQESYVPDVETVVILIGENP